MAAAIPVAQQKNEPGAHQIDLEPLFEVKFLPGTKVITIYVFKYAKVKHATQKDHSHMVDTNLLALAPTPLRNIEVLSFTPDTVLSQAGRAALGTTIDGKRALRKVHFPPMTRPKGDYLQISIARHARLETVIPLLNVDNTSIDSITIIGSLYTTRDATMLLTGLAIPKESRVLEPFFRALPNLKHLTLHGFGAKLQANAFVQWLSPSMKTLSILLGVRMFFATRHIVALSQRFLRPSRFGLYFRGFDMRSHSKLNARSQNELIEVTKVLKKMQSLQYVSFFAPEYVDRRFQVLLNQNIQYHLASQTFEVFRKDQLPVEALSVSFRRSGYTLDGRPIRSRHFGITGQMACVELRQTNDETVTDKVRELKALAGDYGRGIVNYMDARGRNYQTVREGERAIGYEVSGKFPPLYGTIFGNAYGQRIGGSAANRQIEGPVVYRWWLAGTSGVIRRLL
ncbi:hypothetical protein P154DRAFT_573079 [Amniculicola lignicola CBS 123094]|uniref:Uncharacterized protein n=1 Tax=Amniculicola lignicola CBS 123094 TaxID=1392246 RepID=A0A6A5WNG4_9PLEO|nr:hypothetical protein P154DRAFT_573079 [Amniculicola lignicola CBS 123094]